MLVLATGTAAQAGAVAAPLAQSGGTIAVAKADSVNIRSGPSTGYPVVGSLAYGQSCPVIGRDTISGWWLLQCPNGVTGWVSPDLVNIIGDPNGVPLYTVAGPTPSQPQPQPTPPPSGWSASYFANRDLQGNQRCSCRRCRTSTSTGATVARDRACRRTTSRRATSAP
ncbi:MAG: SH3 domain-containing protein [Caldilinea sp.]|nr:SH3 domain-containing protein [Caldilinea sp.]